MYAHCANVGVVGVHASMASGCVPDVLLDVLLDARVGPYPPMCALIVWIVHARGMVIDCLLLDVYGVGGFYIVVVVALPSLLALVCFYIGMV